MENKVIQPLNNNIQPEQNNNQNTQRLVEIANTPTTQIPRFENQDFRKDVEYVKMKIAFFFFTLSMLNLFFLFAITSIFLVGIPFLIFTVSFYLDVRKRYKRAISLL